MEKEPKLEYIVIDFFETAGGEFDNLLNENKGKRFYSIERLNEILEKAKELYPEDETGYSKVYLDNFIRYGEDLYKFHYGRVDIDNTAVNIELPENYDEQIEKMFSENINSDKDYIKSSIRKITTPKEKMDESIIKENTNNFNKRWDERFGKVYNDNDIEIVDTKDFLKMLDEMEVFE